MIFCRKGDCLTCGCKVTIARYDSLAKVLGRMDETLCPQCGSEMAWRDGEAPLLFNLSGKGARCET